MSEDKKSGKSSKPRSGRADVVVVRNLFALTVLRRMTLLAMMSVTCAVVSLFAAYQVFKVKTPPQFIQLTEDSRVFPVLPLNEPSIDEGELLAFAVESVKRINTYDYINWRDQLQAEQTRFSPSAWTKFVTELRDSATLNAVQSRYLVVSARPMGPPRVVKSGVPEKLNSYTWLVEVPVQVKYQAPPSSGVNSSNTQEGTVSLYISRVPLEVSTRGYAIQIYQFDTSTKPK